MSLDTLVYWDKGKTTKERQWETSCQSWSCWSDPVGSAGAGLEGNSLCCGAASPSTGSPGIAVSNSSSSVGNLLQRIILLYLKDSYGILFMYYLFIIYNFSYFSYSSSKEVNYTLAQNFAVYVHSYSCLI